MELTKRVCLEDLTRDKADFEMAYHALIRWLDDDERREGKRNKKLYATGGTVFEIYERKTKIHVRKITPLSI